MDLRDPFVFCFAGFDAPHPFGGPASLQLLHDGPKTIGRLGMPGAHVVVEIRGMIDEAGFPHVGFLAEAQEAVLPDLFQG